MHTWLYKNLQKFKVADCILLSLLLIFFYKIFNGSYIFGDDFSEIYFHKDLNIVEFFGQDLHHIRRYLFGLPNYFGLFWSFVIFGDELLFGYAIIKAIAHIICIFLVYKFFLIYLSPRRSFIAALLFIFLPTHDVTQHWYMTLAYIISPALLLYSYYLVSKRRFFLSFICSVFGIFFFYVSPPFFLTLALLLLYKKKYAESLIYILPGLSYIFYYFLVQSIVLVSDPTGGRISGDIQFFEILINLPIQALTMLEASIGFSALIKFYNAIISVDFLDVCTSILIGLFCYFSLAHESSKNNFRSLDLILLGVGFLLLSIIMYSFTGSNWHNSINLSNRSLIYSSFLIVIFFLHFFQSREGISVLMAIIFLANLGLANHWHDWSRKQQEIIANVEAHKIYQVVDQNDLLIVKGGLYSKFGNYENIEFLVSPWIADAIFNKVSAKILPLTSYLSIKNNILLDLKWDDNYQLIGNQIYLYDVSLNNIRALSKEELAIEIENTEPPMRHWFQQYKESWVAKKISEIIPSLGYLFK